MRKILMGAMIVLLTGASSAWSQDPIQPPGKTELEDAQNSFIFVFDPNLVGANDVPVLARDLAQEQRGSIRHFYQHTIRGFSANVSAEGAARIAENNPLIKYYEPNTVVWAVDRPTARPDKRPNKGPGGDGEASALPPQVTPWGIDRVGGVSGDYSGGNQAWIIDSGIDSDHPDLNVNVAQCVNFARGKSCDDGYGHGTHVAGTVGAINNDIGVVGVAPGVPVVSVRVLNRSGSGTLADVIKGVDYVAANAQQGDCANLSLGANTDNTSLDDAVISAAGKGIFFTLAAGNDSTHADEATPARADGANIYTISAIDQNDQLASFSNFGMPPVDFAAPGVGVLSTYKDGGLATASGTSMAAPHACGVLLMGAPSADGDTNSDPTGDMHPIIHR